MKKNKIAISIFAVACVISIMVGYSLIKQHENNNYDQIAVMTQQNDGTYIRSNMSVFGNDDYEFDHAVCNNGTTVTANSNGGVNLKLLGTDKCTIYLKKKKSIIEKIISSAQPSTGLNYSVIGGSNEINTVTDDNFSKEEQTYTVDTTHQSYYMTYADTYTFNSPTGIDDYPTYTLTSPQVGKYSDIYGSLAGKYIVNYEGHNSSTAVKSTIIDRIYKVVSATANSITYIPSSYTMEFTNSTTGIYTAEDENNTISYYFRGNVTDNYLKFGKWTNEVYRGYNSDQSEYKDYFTKTECQNSESIYGSYYNYGCNKSPVAGKDMYWRIVRLNGDGTLRLMYDGTEAYANGTKSLNRVALQYQEFNTTSNNIAYAGYMYGDINSTEYSKVYENKYPSAIKTALEIWYEKNFAGTEYESKIGDMSFCNDRSVISDGDGYFSYGAMVRLGINKSPSLICPQKENDLFTSNASIQGGNGRLDKPIGLLTADEVALAGGVEEKFNRSYYVNKGNDYWLSSPSYVDYSYVYGYLVSFDSELFFDNDINSIIGAVPVINLSVEAANQLKGSGTMDDPYHF